MSVDLDLDEDSDLIDALENSICAEYMEYLELLEGVGYYIPFVTTINYLTHAESKKALGIKTQTRFVN